MTGRQSNGSVSEKRPDKKRFFKDRELILRSDGKVVFFRLGAGAQKGICVFFGLVLAWAASTSLSTWWQVRLNDDKAAEIIEARLSYERLRGDLGAYQKQIAELAAGIAARQKQALGEEDAALEGVARATPYEIDLAALAEISSGIGTAFDRIARDLDVSEADRNRIVQSRDSLHGKIGDLESALADERRSVDRLTGDIARLEDVLETRGRTIEALEETRGALSDRIVALSDSLRSSERRRDRLVDDVKSLGARIAELDATNADHVAAREALAGEIDSLRIKFVREQAKTRDAREGMADLIAEVSDVLSSDGDPSRPARVPFAIDAEDPEANDPRRYVTALDTELGEMFDRYRQASSYARRVDGALDHVLESLVAVTGTEPANRIAGGADSELSNADDRPAVARALVDEIQRLHNAQRELVERLNAQVEADVGQAEGLLKMAGLDIDALLEKSGVGGQGGPLEEIEFHGGSSEALSQEVATLQGLVARRRALAETLRCVPLVAPVDYYHLTSPFGKRKDPINGRWSRHKGIDLGAWPGTKVRATGAGKIVEAGTHRGYGKMVRIDHGCGIETVYAHLKRIKVKRGQEVTHREEIGTLGSTGRSTGPHVHYEIRVNGQPIDPAKVMEAGRHVFKT